MADTYTQEMSDPTFAAYERSKRAALELSAPEATRQSQSELRKLDNDLEYSGPGGIQERNEIQDSRASLSDRGFGSVMSGPRAMAESRIREAIANRWNDRRLTALDRTQSIEFDLARELALSGLEKNEEANAALKRLTADRAAAGLGI